jgi:hypothetical protein
VARAVRGVLRSVGDPGKSCSSRSSRFLILLLILDFGSFRAFAAAVRLFNSTALTKHSISLRLRIFALRKIVEKDLVDCSATTHGVIFAKYVAQITKQQGRYAVGHRVLRFRS